MFTLANYYGHRMVGGGDWAMLIGMLLIWILIPALLVLLLVSSFRNNRPETAADKRTPLDHAKERYARGQIKKAEFDQIKKDLKQK